MRAANGGFRPCGLVALSMFTDKYELRNLDTNVAIDLHQSEVALSADDRIYEDKVIPVEGKRWHFTVEGQPSWLTRGDFYEHFKVWQRTPASPHVRNLWARMPTGLDKGRYEIRLVENSAVWTESWKVSEKFVVISEEHWLGSRSCCEFLGAVCL